MRNFIRVLRFSWAYRTRLVLSALAAVAVAVFWSLNLSAVYPVLQILSTDRNLHQWVDQQIAEYGAKANDPERQRKIKLWRDQLQQVAADPAAPDRDNQQRRLARDLAHMEAEQEEFDRKVTPWVQHKAVKILSLVDQ